MKRYFILTIGEHGIEGFVGSAMQQRFIEKYLPHLDPATTGIVFVHVINPWGMKHRRRVNAHNIDLNRNFVWDSRGFDPAINPEYDRVKPSLNPGRKIQAFIAQPPETLPQPGTPDDKNGSGQVPERHPAGTVPLS